MKILVEEDHHHVITDDQEVGVKVPMLVETEVCMQHFEMVIGCHTIKVNVFNGKD